MMMDGVPGVRAAEGVRPLNLSGKSTQQRGGDRRLREPAAGISGNMGRARAQRIVRRPPPRGSGIGQRQGGIAELTQGVIAAAQDFALHRQGRVLAVVAVVLGRQPVVVGVIGGPAPGRALGRLKRRPPQLR